MKKLFSLIAILFPVLLYGQTSSCSPAPQSLNQFWFKLSPPSNEFIYPDDQGKYPGDCVHEQFAVGCYWLEYPIRWITHQHRLFHAEWITDPQGKLLSAGKWGSVKIQDTTTGATISCLDQPGVNLMVTSLAPNGPDSRKCDLDRYIRGASGPTKATEKMASKADPTCVLHVCGAGYGSLTVQQYQPAPSSSPAKAKRASH
jgi:hypothetical protein